jgi:hypothetical protein
LDYSATTAEHLFERAQRSQQIGAYGSILVGHGDLPDANLSGVTASG